MNIRILLPIFLLVLHFNIINAQELNWYQTLKGDCYAREIKANSKQELVMGGSLNGCIELSSNESTISRCSNGEYNMLLLKYSGNGEIQWAHSIGGNNEDVLYGMTVDSDDNIIITGYLISNSVDFDPSDDAYYINDNSSSSIGYIAKYNDNGEILWGIPLQGSSPVLNTRIQVDEDNYIYTVGMFYHNADLDPTSNSANLSSNGDRDIFIAKYSPDGEFMWAKSIGSSTLDRAMGLEVGNGKVIVTGYYTNTIDINPGAGQEIFNSNGGHDAFILTLNTDGDFLWADTFGNSEDNYVDDLVIDESGHVICITNLVGSYTLSDGSTVSSIGGQDMLVIKYDELGNILWHTIIGGNNSWDGIFQITLDDSQNYVVTGGFNGSIQSSNSTLSSLGASDIYIGFIEPNGGVLEQYQIASTQGEVGAAITFRDKKIYLYGGYNDSLSLTNNNDNIITQSDGNRFIASFDSFSQATTLENSQDEIPQISVTPNPTNSTIAIRYPVNMMPTQIHLTDLNGRRLITVQGTTGETNLNLSNIPEGIYLVQLINENYKIARKILKKN